MSQRFYINDLQVFGNNEIGDLTMQELEKQGIIIDYDDYIIKKQKIKDPQALLEAVVTDSLLMLKEGLTRDKKWEEITDADFFKSYDPTFVKRILFDSESPAKSYLDWVEYFMDSKRIMAGELLRQHLMKWCKKEKGKLVIKPHKNIWVEMY